MWMGKQRVGGFTAQLYTQGLQLQRAAAGDGGWHTRWGRDKRGTVIYYFGNKMHKGFALAAVILQVEGGGSLAPVAARTIGCIGGVYL